MRPRPFSALLLLWLAPAFASTAETPASAEKKAPASAPALSSGSETRARSLTSTHITDAIRATLPTFQPAPPPPRPTTPAPLAGTNDNPVVLERVVVTERKAPDLNEFSMLTKAGQRAYLEKQFPGAVSPGGDPLREDRPNYAAQMLRDKRRQEQLNTFGDTVTALRLTGDLAGSKALKEEMQRALYRRYDWRDERIDRTYNRDRR